MPKMPLTGKPLIVILGPTAVGKTDFAIQLGQAINGQIINADSRQIYRQMDIGTAKPTLEQQAALPHHLLGVVNPDEKLSAAQYQQMAYQRITTLHEASIVPLLVGGTGQYITSVIEGWTIPAVAPNLQLRQELETVAQAEGAGSLHQRLTTLDPIAAQSIDYRNIRRVIRALEVCIETGTPISQLQQKHPPPYRILCYGLTMDRERLYARADARIEMMLQHGFLGEVQRLLDAGYASTLPSMSGLGYRELATYLSGTLSLAEAVQKTKFATRDFIRRQYTWFKGHNANALWIESETIPFLQIVEQTQAWMREA